MADSIINIIINTVKKGGGDKDAVAGVKKLTYAFKDLTGISIGSMTAVGAVGAAIGGISKFVKDAIEDTVEYATEVDNMSRLLGISAEDTSRLIQASDDLFLSQETLLSGLQAATRQGIDVSIEGLKELSKQYLALPEGITRSEFVLKTFGRSGAEMGKLMEIGASGIDEATAAIAKNMVITDQSMDDIIKYKQSIDNLNDSWQGVKYTVGTEVIPELDLFIRMIMNGKDEVTKMELKAWRLEKGMWGLMGAFEGNREKAQLLRDQIAWLTGSFETGEAGVSDFYRGISNMEGEIIELIPEIDHAVRSMTEFELSFSKAEAGADQFKLSTDFIREGLRAWGDEMGTVGDEIWHGFLVGIGEITPAAAEEFARLEVLMANARQMAAQGVSIPVIVSYLMAGSGSYDPYGAVSGALPGSTPTGPSASDWVFKGTKSSTDKTKAWYSPALGQWFYGEKPPGMALGGFVTPGQPYIVGEVGPELFVPNSSGYVVPNNQITKNSNSTNNFYISGAGDPNAVANAVMRKLRLQGAA